MSESLYQVNHMITTFFNIISIMPYNAHNYLYSFSYNPYQAIPSYLHPALTKTSLSTEFKV